MMLSVALMSLDPIGKTTESNFIRLQDKNSPLSGLNIVRAKEIEDKELLQNKLSPFIVVVAPFGEPTVSLPSTLSRLSIITEQPGAMKRLSFIVAVSMILCGLSSGSHVPPTMPKCIPGPGLEDERKKLQTIEPFPIIMELSLFKNPEDRNEIL